jgi:hypothetical protein
MSALEDITRDYRTAFLRYLPRREEAPLNCGYELGRSAVADGVSVLELARVHHEVLLEALRETRPEDLTQVATAASEFFLEVLATYDMTQRAFFEDTLASAQAGSAGSSSAAPPSAGSQTAGAQTADSLDRESERSRESDPGA